MPDEKTILSESNTRMQKSVQVFIEDLKTIRTSRASPDLIENLTADYYGVPTPLNQMASITVPDARLLMIQPWDKQALGEIEKSILQSDVGLVPNNDGTVIRINIPILTEERRKDLVKLVGRRLEDSRIAVRNIRREGVDQIKKLENSKQLSSDDSRVAQQEIQKITDSNIQQLETLAKDKEREVMEV
ncbi:MAG: ribosome recycling factor [Chloroflexota bacterium]|nr:ribosome recycling factor [Chloroflexota bacterium]